MQSHVDVTLHPDDRILGSPDAPITIVEFSSLTCSHCATFHKTTLPRLKQEWIETGKARLVYRDYPLDKPALRAAAWAMCFEGERYFEFLDQLFQNQQEWAQAKDLDIALAQAARRVGMDARTIEDCLSDESIIDRIIKRQVEARENYDIQSTPNFFINGRRVKGALGFEQFKEILEDASP
jgi:protein-disulfide isomerase